MAVSFILLNLRTLKYRLQLTDKASIPEYISQCWQARPPPLYYLPPYYLPPFTIYSHLLYTPIYYLLPFAIYPHLLFTPIYHLPQFNIYPNLLFICIYISRQSVVKQGFQKTHFLILLKFEIFLVNVYKTPCKILDL